jgi:hypothetical protein
LALNPNDQDAQYNLDLAQRELDQKNKNPKRQKGKDKNNGKQGGKQGDQQGGNQASQQQQQQAQQQPPKGGKFGLRKGSGGKKSGGGQQQNGSPQQGGAQPQSGSQQQNGGQEQSPGQGQQDGQGQSQGQAQEEQPSSQAPPGPRLSRDQVETMLNQLKNDQHKYEGAFNPLKHYGNKQQPEDPGQQFLDQFSGIQPQKTPTPPTDPNYKDW